MPEEHVGPESPGQDTVQPAAPVQRRRDDLVPAWLLVAVAILLLAVAGVGAFVVIRTMEAQKEGFRQPMTAIQQLEAEIVADPGDINNRVKLAYLFQQEGRFVDAIAEYDFALRADKDHLGALYNKSICLLELNRGPEAETFLIRVLEIAPNHALAAKALGQYYVDSGQAEKIPSLLVPAVQANPNLADLHALLGIGYERTGQVSEAIAEYQLAVRLDPQMNIARQGLLRLEGQAQ